MPEWLTRVSVGEWLTVCGMLLGVLGWAVRQHVRMNRAADEVQVLRADFDQHVVEANSLIERFVVLEREAVDMDRRMDELLQAVRLDKEQAREDRRDLTASIITAIGDLRAQVDGRLADLRELIYSTVADRRKQ